MSNHAIEFVNISDDRPKYGTPVLIKINGTIQNVVFVMNGGQDDDSEDWFEPHFFDNEREFEIKYTDVESWATFPDWQD